MTQAPLKKLGILVCIASMAMLFGCSGGSSSGGIYKQAFNVTGQWAGLITDGTLTRPITVTINDAAGTVTGTMLVTNHTCFAGANLSGTAAAAGVNTENDNPLTTDQENSNEGTITVSIEVIETIGEEDFTRTTNFNMNGDSSSLVGKYAGNWIPQSDENGVLKEIPGFEESKFCRAWFEGDIVLSKLWP